MAPPPTEPRIDSRKCDPRCSLGRKIRPICPPTQRGKSVLFCDRKQPGAMRKRARKGRRLRTEGVQNRRFWRAFGDFPRDGKVTRVPSMALPCSRGAPAIGGCRDYQSRKSPPGAPSMARPCSRGAPALGSAEGAQPPRIVKQELRGGAPAQSSPFVWDIQKRGQIFSIFHKNILPERVAFMQYKGNSKNAGNGAVFEL